MEHRACTAIVLSIAVISTSGDAQERLACDADQLSDACVECLVDVADEEQRGLCFAEALPEPLSSGLGGTCPESIAEYETTAKQIDSSVRAVKVANAKLAASLRPFETSGGDCSTLPDEVRTISGSSESDEWSVEAAIVGEMQTCIASDLESIYALVAELGQGTGLTSSRIRRLQDIDIDLTVTSIEMESELARAAGIRKQIEAYARICRI